MSSQLTVRLPGGLQRKISLLAKRLHLKRSDIVRMALEMFVQNSQHENEDSPFLMVKHLLGSVSTGIPDLGESHREHLLKHFRKHA